MRIAYFITPHGYGHAARASAIMGAIHRLDENSSFDIFTTIPEWFFKDSLQGCPFTYQPWMVDVGFIQTSPLAIDLMATVSRLQMFIPFREDLTADAVNFLKQNQTQSIFCDISPLGIHLARELNIPSVLIENFTWDWMYRDYLDIEAGFHEAIQYFSGIYKQVDYHIQTRPFCDTNKHPAFISNPVSRQPRTTRAETRSRLGVKDQDPLIMITMGGIQLDFSFLKRLDAPNSIRYVVPGLESGGNLPKHIIPLPHHSNFFHPDLVEACDAVIGKVGYSTLAEVYNAGKPFGYIPRRGFKESPVLVKFIQENMSGEEIQEDLFLHGDWHRQANRLLGLPSFPNNSCNGADQVADYLVNHVLSR